MLVFCKEQNLIATIPLTKDELAKVKEAKPAPADDAPAEAAPKKRRGKKADVPAEPPAAEAAAE
jgi:hypothetical protein